MSAIVADGLTKRFGDFAAVDGVSFEVPAGQLVAVLGPNGGGTHQSEPPVSEQRRRRSEGIRPASAAS